MKSYGKATKVGMLWSWLGSTGMEIIWLPTAMITARLLTPADFGVAATASFFLTLATRLTQFGFNASLVRMNPLTKEHSDTMFLMSVGLGVSAYLALALNAPFVAAFFRTPELAKILPIAAASFLLIPIGTVPSALMLRELRYKELTYCTWISSATSTVTTIAAALLGFGVWSLIYGQLSAAVALTVSKLAFARWRPSFRFDRAAARESLSFGAGIYVLRLLEYAALNLDSMVVGRVMGMGTLGLYDKAFNLSARILDRVNQAGPSISFRVFSVIQEEARFRNAYRQVLLSSTLIMYPLLAVCAAAAPYIFAVLFGRRWMVAAWPFQVLCLASAVKVLSLYAASVVEARGWVWSEVWRQALYAALVVIGVALFARWGISGAAFAVLMSTLVMGVLMQHLLLSTTPLTLRDICAPQLPALVCAVCAGTTALATQIALERVWTNEWLVLPVVVAVGVGVWAAFILLTPTRAVRQLVQQVVEDILPGLQKFFPGQSMRAGRI